MMKTFSIQRVWNLIKIQYFESKKSQKYLFLGVFIVMAIVLSFHFFITSNTENSTMFQLMLFMNTGIVFTAINSSFSFKEFRKNTYLTNQLIVPATSFERLLSNFFYNAIFSLLVYFAVFAIAGTVSVLVCGIITGHFKFVYLFLFLKKMLLLTGNADYFLFFGGTWFVMNALFITGSIRFKEYPAIYILTTYIGYSFVVSILSIVFAVLWLEEVMNTLQEFGSALPNFRIAMENMINNPHSFPMLHLWSFVMFSMLMLISFFLIKEKEIK